MTASPLARQLRHLRAWVTLCARGPCSVLTSAHAEYLGGCLLIGTRGGRGACPALLTRTHDSEAELGRQGARAQGSKASSGRTVGQLLGPETTPPPGPGPSPPAGGRPGLVVGPDSPLVQAAPSGHSQMRHIQAPNPIKPGTHICFAKMRPGKEPSPRPGAADIHVAGGAPWPVHPDPIVPPLIELPRDSPNSRLGKRRVKRRGQRRSAHVGGEEGASLCEALSQHLAGRRVGRLRAECPCPAPSQAWTAGLHPKSQQGGPAQGAVWSLLGLQARPCCPPPCLLVVLPPARGREPPCLSEQAFLTSADRLPRIWTNRGFRRPALEGPRLHG